MQQVASKMLHMTASDLGLHASEMLCQEVSPMHTCTSQARMEAAAASSVCSCFPFVDSSLMHMHDVQVQSERLHPTINDCDHRTSRCAHGKSFGSDKERFTMCGG